MSESNAYHPLNVLKPVTDNVWIVDARLPSSRLEMPIRMTVLRLNDGSLILHSPTPYNRALHDALSELGTLRYLVAPNIAHWMYIKEWRDSVPGARSFAVEGLGSRTQVQNSGLRIDQELTGDGQPFGSEIEIVMISAPLFQEIALFHQPSRTLVLTDMVQNFEPRRLPLSFRLLAFALGNTAPDGRAPLYLRVLIRLNKADAAKAAQRLLDFDPERVIFPHGKWFETDGTYHLRHSLRWLLPSSNTEVRDRSISPWIAASVAAGALAVGFLIWRSRRRRSQIDRIAEDLMEFARSKKWGQKKRRWF